MVTYKLVDLTEYTRHWETSMGICSDVPWRMSDWVAQEGYTNFGVDDDHFFVCVENVPPDSLLDEEQMRTYIDSEKLRLQLEFEQ